MQLQITTMHVPVAILVYLQPSYFKGILILATFASKDLAYIHLSDFTETPCTQIYLLVCIKHRGFGVTH